MEKSYFKDSKNFFNYIDNKLISGIKITKVNELEIFFSDGDIIELDDYIEKSPKEYIIPNYRNESVINIISGIRKNYGFRAEYGYDKNLFNKKFKHIVYLLLDGLGVNVLNNSLNEDSFLKTNYYKSINAIYPSTTAAATTSAKSGLYPLESGWTGWHNYIREANRNLILFTGIDYYSYEMTGIKVDKLIPYKPFFNDMKLGRIIEPDFKKKEIKLDSLLKRSLRNLEKDRIQYIYYNNPDDLLHIYGIGSKNVKEEMEHIDNLIRDYSNKLPKNTLLIISADHGHTKCSPLNISKFKALNDLLERKPSNDARCITFKVKSGLSKQFEELFNLLFKNYFILYKSSDLIELGILGNPNRIINERIEDFMADYTAIAIGDKYFKTVDDDIIMKSHHAGITKDEMEVPLIVIKK